MDSKPFHPDTYVGPEQEEDDAIQQAETLREKSMSIKLKVENTMRWKWIKDEYGGDVGRIFRAFLHFIKTRSSADSPTVALYGGLTVL